MGRQGRREMERERILEVWLRCANQACLFGGVELHVEWMRHEALSWADLYGG